MHYIFVVVIVYLKIFNNENYGIMTMHYLHAVHGFEQLSYTTPESEALQGINFHPNIKGTGQAVNIAIISGTINLEEDIASKFISHQNLFIIPFYTHHSNVRHFKFHPSVSTTGN